MGAYREVRKGECLSSIAQEHGYYPGTIWEATENDDLRELRGDPNVLAEGDRLFLPDKEVKVTTCATGKKHRFTRRGVPARFRLQILNADKPRPNLEYKLTIDETLVLTGTTTGEGVLDVAIPPGARRGLLYIEEDDAEHELHFGGLDPMFDASGAANEGAGVRQRLAHLGYLRDLDAPDEDLPAAIAMFQRKAGIDPTGALDDATLDKLLQGHDRK